MRGDRLLVIARIGRRVFLQQQLRPNQVLMLRLVDVGAYSDIGMRCIEAL